MWYGNSSNQDCKALQRIVRLAERISGSALPSLQDIYLKRCKSRAAKILKDSTHPGNHHFCLLPSGKRFRSMMAKTERLRRSFFPQAIRLLNIVLSLINTYKIVTGYIHILITRIFLCTYPEQPVCTSLPFIFILLFIKSQYTVFCTSYCFALFIPLHILLLFLFFTIYMLLCCVTFI